MKDVKLKPPSATFAAFSPDVARAIQVTKYHRVALVE